jgi:hypothetical protein
MAIYNGNSPMILQSMIHQEFNTGELATGYKALITGLVNTGDLGQLEMLTNHLGREYFRKQFNANLSSYILDTYDAGFRPTTVTGLYS